MRPRLIGLAALALSLVTTAARAQGPHGNQLTVFAAASLTDAFREIGRMLERRQPGLRVAFNFAGSQQLAAQILEGAPADVFASADDRWMTVMQDSGLVAGEARVFAHNRLLVIVPASNPARIRQLADLGRPGVKLVLALPSVPAGAYALQVFSALARSPGYPADFSRRVLDNVVSQEQNVKAVAAKVQLGEADAGVVYVSDVTTALARDVHRIAIPDSANALASYPVAALKNALNRAAAEAFITLLLSEEGQAVLQRFNFLPAAASR